MSAIKIITNGYPAWVLAAAVLALVEPGIFTWFGGEWITAGLGVIMLGMGLTLTGSDFKRIASSPLPVISGVALQYLVMPFSGWLIAMLFDLPAPFAVGLILVASCPGGTASNVMSFLARADVPLSVTMTSITTILAVAATPFYTSLLAGNRVDVPAMGLFIDTLRVVLLPVAAGVVINTFFSRLSGFIRPAAPVVAVAFIVLIVGSIIGAGRDRLLESGLAVAAAVFCLHASGFLWGYILARILTRDVIAARTISIEVGMQNSGLGVVLARSNFADPLFAVPSAISSLFHSIIASMLAAVWRRSAEKYRKVPESDEPAPGA